MYINVYVYIYSIYRCEPVFSSVLDRTEHLWIRNSPYIYISIDICVYINICIHTLYIYIYIYIYKLKVTLRACS